MQLNTYLHFKDNCEAALQYYVQHLGAKIGMVHRYGGSPAMGMAPADFGNKILHAELHLGGTTLYCSDCPPNQYAPQAGFGLSLNVASLAEAESIFGALAEGGKIGMPLQKSFFAERFGVARDRFGIPWMVIFGQPS
ncbi:MAG: VOC family protein [Terriglobales bacterium]